MLEKEKDKLVFTIQDLCRVCYTCVRECPAKAIKIINGQAQVINERCIGCGNCIKVCSQGAKSYRNSIDRVKSLLNQRDDAIAIVAPSFPAAFKEFKNYKTFVGAVKSLGFKYVCEVAFGADLVAKEYNKLWVNGNEKRYISSDCPAIVSYICRYHPSLINNFAPVVSPMVAMARVVREKYIKNAAVVFIGPCIAKKEESPEIDEALTFMELRKLFEARGINHSRIAQLEFDPPVAGRGSIFPISHGLVQTTNISSDALENDIIIAEGRMNFQDAIKEYESGLINTNHLELLCCEGCILGPGMSNELNKYTRSALVANYVKEKLKNINMEQWEKDIETYSKINLTGTFEAFDRRIKFPSDNQIEKVLLKMGKVDEGDHLDCGACGYDTCREHAIAIINELAETEMCLPYTIEKLHRSVEKLEDSNKQLASVQQTLKQAEKLASMGQLSAGIAHELNNPLGVLVMYSNILLEETDEKSHQHSDLKLIVEQANRCKKIVSGLLNFARKNQVNPKEINIIELVQKCIDSVLVPKNVKVRYITELVNHYAFIDSEQITQVLTNLMKNAVEAMNAGGELNILITDENNDVIFKISDTGMGIRKKDLDKIFEPFYTTKGIGFGTGLGLATAYGIVKMHKGHISVNSNADDKEGPTGTTFTIKLPRK